MQPPPKDPPRLVGDNAAASAHAHEHTHGDGTTHSHPHLHAGGQPHDHPRAHDHAHAHEHAHTHADGTTHSHAHVHAAAQAEDHDHEHEQVHEAGGAHRVLDVGQAILARNDRLAERNRGFLRARGLVALNVVSAPGAGKTTLLEKTVAALAPDCPAAVIVGDLATANDARRIREAGAPVVQITTGTVCHLDAEMVARGLEQLDLAGRRLLIVENVGNLVCPADFDLGEDARVVLVSVTEGEDKPLKYPPIFKSAHVVVITKADLAEAAGADLAALRQNLRAVAPQARLLEISARTGAGMEGWLGYLRGLAAGQ